MENQIFPDFSVIGRFFWHLNHCATPLNYLSLDMDGCGIQKQTILHEAMHVLGFVHEQSRPDYKKHIKLFRNNIRADAFKDNFRAVRKSRQNIMTPYDCASIIHQFF